MWGLYMHTCEAITPDNKHNTSKIMIEHGQPPMHCGQRCHVDAAGQLAGGAKPGSKWKVVADKMGKSEGPGGLAALLANMNNSHDGPAALTLPIL